MRRRSRVSRRPRHSWTVWVEQERTTKAVSVPVPCLCLSLHATTHRRNPSHQQGLAGNTSSTMRPGVILFALSTVLLVDTCVADRDRSRWRRARRKLSGAAGSACRSDGDCASGTCTCSTGRRLFGAPRGVSCTCEAGPPSPPPAPPAIPPPLGPLVATGQYFASPSSTWQQAEDYCVANGGHLVSIHSSAQNQAVIAFMNDGSNGAIPPIFDPVLPTLRPTIGARVTTCAARSPQASPAPTLGWAGTIQAR